MARSSSASSRMRAYWRQVGAVRELTGLPAPDARALVRELRAAGVRSVPATRRLAERERRQAAAQRAQETRRARREAERPPAPARAPRAPQRPREGAPAPGPVEAPAGGAGGPIAPPTRYDIRVEDDFDFVDDVYGFEAGEEAEY